MFDVVNFKLTDEEEDSLLVSTNAFGWRVCWRQMEDDARRQALTLSRVFFLKFKPFRIHAEGDTKLKIEINTKLTIFDDHDEESGTSSRLAAAATATACWPVE